MNKAFLTVIVFILALVMASCAVQPPEIPIETSAPTPTSAPETQVPETQKPTEDANTVSVRTESYNFTRLDSNNLPGYAFNDNVAWAHVGNENNKIGFPVVINTNGECLYIAKGKFNADYIKTTPFINGLSAIYPAESGLERSKPGFIIVDTTGKEVYNSTDETLYMCGQAEDGLFILIKHNSGFDHDGWFVYTLGNDLTLKETGIEADEAMILQCQYNESIEKISDGLYYDGRNNCFLNLENKSYFDCQDYNDGFIYYGHNDKYVFIQPSGVMGQDSVPGISYVPIGVFKTAHNSNEVVTKVLKDNSCVRFAGYDDDSSYQYYIPKEWKDGAILHLDDKTPVEYLDINGALIISFPTLPDDAYYEDFDDFSGDYAALYMVGVDGKPYATIMDSTGKTQYDPIQVNNRSLSYQICSCNGYIFFHGNKEGLYDILAPDGSHKKMGDDLSSISNESIIYSDNGFHMVIKNGWIFYNGINPDYKYISVDGQKTISKITASYNKNGSLIYTDISGVKKAAG